MFGIGGQELLLILLLALIILGPKKLPEMAKTIGKAMGNFRGRPTISRERSTWHPGRPLPSPPHLHPSRAALRRRTLRPRLCSRKKGSLKRKKRGRAHVVPSRRDRGITGWKRTSCLSTIISRSFAGDSSSASLPWLWALSQPMHSRSGSFSSWYRLWPGCCRKTATSSTLRCPRPSSPI